MLISKESRKNPERIPKASRKNEAKPRLETRKIMARIIPINIIKGISGKYGKNADFYFATNTSSGKIRISRLPQPIHRPPTEKQKEQRTRFAARHAAVTAWLNANKPSELNGPKGTKAYQHVQWLKRKLRLSLINQVLLKYMDENNVIRLPEPKEQRSCKPQKSKKTWKRISFENTRAFHREKTSNCPKPNLKLDFKALKARDCERQHPELWFPGLTKHQRSFSASP